ncbi:MAG TPA: cytochrome c-type biogenesis protein [Candidatus Acidoferrum sp.]|jgi:cytochrome c-type biogenesis protein CcmH
MIKTKRFLILALMLSFAIVPLWTMNLTAQSDRARQVGMHLKCMCKGCDMSAGGCSHPGGAFSGPCPTAKGMMQEVDQHIAKGETDEQIIQAFVAEYGAIVYVEPPKHGFGLVAWIMPFFYTILGLAVVVFVIRKWRNAPKLAGAEHSNSAGVKISPEAMERARAQAQRETED